MKQSDRVLLCHGSGGLMTHRLIEEYFVKSLSNAALAELDDAARLTLPGQAVALTTDSFVVDPLFFPGGNIGKLAVCGTVNDLAVSGARPLYLTAGYILEEGLPLEQLRQIIEAMAQTAAAAGVQIVAGDTKVVPRGKADGCFINTAGVGVMVPNLQIGAKLARPGDKVLISGSIGEHGAAIMAVRSGIELRSPIVSDCAPLSSLLVPLLEAHGTAVHVMRDPTRGGLGTTLCELAGSSRATIQIEEQALPVSESVRAACELLGLDPLYLACEGRAIIIAAPEAAPHILQQLQAHPDGRQAAIIGEVQVGKAQVVARTPFGSHRLITMPASDPLPRIC